MRLGFSLPMYGPAAREPGGIARYAAEMEKASAASFWVGDRLLSPVEPRVGYNGRDDLPEEFAVAYDPLAALSVAAAATGSALLGSSTINAPWYPAPLLARALTSIDVASGGRLLAGFGVGWSPEEYGAVGVPFGERGARLDDVLSLLDSWWTADPVAHDGTGYTVPASTVALRPVRRPPVYLGGFSAAALRRVGARADGWLPVWQVPARMDVSVLTGALGAVRAAAADAGRDPAAVRTALRVNAAAEVTARQIADDVRRVTAALGADDTFVDLMYQAGSVDEMIERSLRVLDLVAAG